MMESCLGGKPERVGPVEVDDIRRDLLGEFTALPAQDSVVQSENLQVFLRVRPFTAAESDNAGSQDCVTIEGPDTVVLKAPKTCQSNRQNDKSLPQTAQRFTFTQVFGPGSSQQKVFEGSVRGLVRDVLDGGNCLVFTYGVTNAGKTFTFLGPDHDSGLLPRSLSVIFNSIDGRLYSRCDLKPQRCRDFSRLTPDQQAAESSSKKNLLRLLKESDKSLTSGRSTLLDGSSLSTDSSVNSVSDADSFCLDVDSNVRFSVWVSFCEIYNDNIHDLLEQVPSGHHKRATLRLSQDVKGNSFIKDLRWVQVNSSEEAYRVMKIGKKNQSFSSTRLNQLSSRSHSIFSIRILRVDDVGVPRVLGISELALCDLAGSERCSRTQNTGERLKEAGNINSSLLTLGKCINAMRLNQHAKFQHHIPFRESKLTHFLQVFFCGAGRVSMVVNINQNSSCFDETLNVLKFSALAQKVVVLNTRPVIIDDAPHRSALELSMIIDEADRRRNVSGRGRKSSMVAWETTLEDVLEDEYGEESDEEEEEEEEESVMEGTVLEAGGEEDKEQEEKDTTMEQGEEVTITQQLSVGSNLIGRRPLTLSTLCLCQQSDREAALRLVLEAQIREEVSAEFMELFNKMEKDYSERLEKEREILEERAEKRVEILKNLVSKTADLPAVSTDNSKEEQAALLEGIIGSLTEDLQKIREDAQSVHHCLAEHSQESSEQQQQKLTELMEICQQKDDVIDKLQAAVEDAVESATRDKTLGESIRSELLHLQQTCRCVRRAGGEEVEESRKRQREAPQEEEKEREPAKKRSLDECSNCDSLFLSLESEQRETSRLSKENKALVNGIFQLQTEVTALQAQLKQQTDRCDSLSEQLHAAEARLRDLGSQSEEKANTISSLTQEVERLRQEVQVEEGRSSSVFHAAMEELKKESVAALQRSADRCEQVDDLQRENRRLEDALTLSQDRCVELSEQLANQKAEFTRQLQSLRVELESEGGALRGRLQEVERSEKERRRHLERENEELEHLKEGLQRREKENRQVEGEEKENRQGEEKKASVVEELKQEMERLQERRGRRQEEDRDFEASSVVKTDGALQKIGELIQSSPSILSSKAKTIIGLVSGHSVDTVTTATKTRRGRKKLYHTDTSSQLLDSLHTMSEAAEEENAHLIIKRQLRSKTCRK
ncbi:Kinesin-like protein KIF20B [Larimichthys crocea]|nr:Kinesin-like protein KIF20B [Larimichthys crocea]